MGSWGAGLFENDSALDFRGSVEKFEKIKNNNNKEELTKMVDQYFFWYLSAITKLDRQKFVEEKVEAFEVVREGKQDLIEWLYKTFFSVSQDVDRALAAAKMQLENGNLSEYIKEEALKAIERDFKVRTWFGDSVKERKEVIASFKKEIS